ncbi:MAG: type I 3-dehydroquinate dehydratase [Acidobacteria bacterium]|nr:type I 3-dehydroquinate dehydratase [Acidobacteriota bacterium]
MHSQVCVSVTGGTMAELRRNRDGAEGADLVEVRLDGVDRPDAAGALEGRRRPVLVTCRPVWEGGRFDGDEESRRRILEEAVACGAEFVDVEARAAFAADLIRGRRGRGVVVSSHTFGSFPPDLEARWRALQSWGAEVAKLAVEVKSLSEALEVMSLANSGPAPESAAGRVLIAMGEAGVASRILAGKLGNRWTYAGHKVAPGQLSPRRLLEEFRFRDLKPDAGVYGVVGNPVSHSRSPAMHNAGFAHLGLNAVYLPLQACDADDFLRFARTVNLAGASITAPFKVALMHAVDELEPLARRVGAINTIVVRDGRWHGANTDVHGFSAPLTGRIAVRGIRATILGAGGAARAVAVALADMGASVTVSARRADAGREIADLAGGGVGEFPPRPGSWDVLVNAIPAGEDAGERNPIEGAALDGEIVFDLVYAPARTRLLLDARAAGCLTIGGLEMLVAQAERQFELWTGQAPPAGLFQAAAARGIDE